MPNTRRIELELQVLEAKYRSFESQISSEVSQYNSGGSQIDSNDLDGQVKFLRSEQDKVSVAIAEKNLELFDLQGA